MLLGSGEAALFARRSCARVPPVEWPPTAATANISPLTSDAAPPLNVGATTAIVVITSHATTTAANIALAAGARSAEATATRPSRHNISSLLFPPFLADAACRVDNKCALIGRKTIATFKKTAEFITAKRQNSPQCHGSHQHLHETLQTAINKPTITTPSSTRDGSCATAAALLQP